MELFLEGYEQFQNSYFKKHEAEFVALSENGQSPKALFIGCSDSRVIPNLVTQSKPGDLFVMRNVGGFIPPYEPEIVYHSAAAGIEYAVLVLGVSDIIVCGHSQCGAISSLYNPLDSTEAVNVKQWLNLGEKAKTLALSMWDGNNQDSLLRITERLSVITQIENLFTYPSIKSRVDNEELFIHGWYYDIATGNIDFYDPESKRYRALSELN